MSNLEEIKDKPKAKRILKDVHFDFIGAHIAYTDGSQGGAASLKNQPYLLKAEDINKELTEEQEEILLAIGEESTPLDKSRVVDKNAPSSSTEVAGGEDVKISKQEEDTMSEANKEQIADLQKQLSVMKAEKQLTAYQFDEDLEKGLAEAISELSEDSASAVIKALEELVNRKDEAVEKANAKKAEEGGNELAKALEKEEGHAIEEEDVNKSFLEEIAESQAALRKEAK